MFCSTQVFRRLGSRLANHRASLSSELGSLWDFIRLDRDRRRSAPTTYEPIHTDTKSPVRLARDLLQVIQETVFSRKFEDTPKRCPLVKQESDLSSDEEDGTERRIANLIDFFFTIVKSQRSDRKGSGGSCFRSEASPDETKPLVPKVVNHELEAKMETLMEFLATTGCLENEGTDNKITLMEFLFGPDDKKPIIEIIEPEGLNEAKINVQNLSYIDETPDEDPEALVDMLIKYMENYDCKDKASVSKCITPCLSEKSKSDVTISKLETFSDISKTKSDSTLTHTQDTVIEKYEDRSSDLSRSERRISETHVDLSNVKNDLENVFEEAIARVSIIRQLYEDDTMSEQEDMENFTAYTKPMDLPYMQSLPFSVDLSDILEEEEPSSKDLRNEEHLYYVRQAAEELVRYIEDKVSAHFDDSDDEFDISSSLKRTSISLIDLRNIPDLPPSMIIKPKVIKVDKSTSTNEISDSLSDASRRIDSACMTEDTTLTSSSEWSERALDKLESLHKFFSKSRLEIIDESDEHIDKIKSPKRLKSDAKSDFSQIKVGQASLDDVEDIQDDFDEKNINDKRVYDVSNKTNKREHVNEVWGENSQITDVVKKVDLEEPIDESSTVYSKNLNELRDEIEIYEDVEDTKKTSSKFTIEQGNDRLSEQDYETNEVLTVKKMDENLEGFEANEDFGTVNKIDEISSTNIEKESVNILTAPVDGDQ